MKKRIFTVILACIMALTCVACGSSSEDVKSADSTSSDSSTNIFNKEGLPIVNKPISFTIAACKPPLSQNTFDEKPAIKKQEEETGIHIDWQEIPSSGWSDKVSLYFASGDLPNAFLSGIDKGVLVQNTDSLVIMNDLIKQYAPNLNESLNKYPEVRSAMTAPDGNIYSLLTSKMSIPTETTGTLWYINKSWIDKLGLTMPTNIEELHNVLMAFKTKDPNGNNQADEIPMSFCQVQWCSKLDAMFGPFGVLNDSPYVQVVDGKVVFQPTEPGYYKALKFYNTLSNEGILDKEGFTQTVEQYNSKGAGSKYGLFCEFGASYVVGEDAARNDYVPLPIIAGMDGTKLYPGSITNQVGNTTGFVITKSCKHPEILTRWYDNTNKDFETKMLWDYGERDYIWEYTDDTKTKWQVTNDNLPDNMTLEDARYTMALGSRGLSFFDRDESALMIYTGESKQRFDAVKALEPYYPKESIPTNALEEPDFVTERSELFVEIDSYIKNFVANSIINGITDEDWEKHLETCKNLKVDIYTKMYQQTYDNLNK